MRYEFIGVTKDMALRILNVVDKWKLAGLNSKALAAENDFGLYDVIVSGSDIALLPMGDSGFEFKNMKSTEGCYIDIEDIVEISIS